MNWDAFSNEKKFNPTLFEEDERNNDLTQSQNNTNNLDSKITAEILYESVDSYIVNGLGLESGDKTPIPPTPSSNQEIKVNFVIK